MRSVIDWYDRRRSGRLVVAGWLATRLAMWLLFTYATRFNGMKGDVTYYHRKISALVDAGLAGTLTEYPTPVVWILSIPYAAATSRTGYLVGFFALMLLLDAAFTFALYRAAGRRHTAAVDFWLLFVLLIGPLTYLRFDLLPAVLAGGALLAARHRPAVAGALTGLGAAVKLWPALLIGVLLVPRRGRRPMLAGFVAVGCGLAALSLVLGGWTRLTSPLTWQSERDLQIESVWATPLMIARALDPHRWRVEMSRYQAFEIFGPGVQAWVSVSSVATVVGLAVIFALIARAFRADAATPVAIGFVVTATIAIMIVTNKTLSPQYLLWLGGPLAAMLLFAGAGGLRSRERRAVKLTIGFALLLALLTQLVFPLCYDWLLGRQTHTRLLVATAITALRNLALLAFTLLTCAYAWVFLRRTRPSDAASASSARIQA